MALFSKFVLPNPVEFLRHIHQVIFLNHKTGADTKTTLDPIVTRAKSITQQSGVSMTTYERTDDV